MRILNGRNRAGTRAQYHGSLIPKSRGWPSQRWRLKPPLNSAFETGDGIKVTRLYRSDDIPAERCWVRAPGWCLAYS
jgi:hypothetical protein